MFVEYRAGTGVYISTNTKLEEYPGVVNPGALFFISTGLGNDTEYLSSVTSAASATFTRLATTTITGRANDMWYGYGAAGLDTGVTMTKVSGDAYWVYTMHGIATSLAWGSAPSVASSTDASGNGSSATTNALTPAVGDILFASVLTSGNASCTMSSSGNTMVWPKGVGTTLANDRRTESCWGVATAASSTTVSWTWSGTYDWVAKLFAITPPAGNLSTLTGTLIKGQLTATLDAAAEA